MSDLDPYLSGPLTPAGHSEYGRAQQKFAKQRVEYRPDPFEVPASGSRSGHNLMEWDQQTSGEPIGRYDVSEKLRPSGGIPRFLRPVEHRKLVRHPQYKTICRPDGTREHYTISRGEVICSCGEAHERYPEDEAEEGYAMSWKEAGLATEEPLPEPETMDDDDWWAKL